MRKSLTLAAVFGTLALAACGNDQPAGMPGGPGAGAVDAGVVTLHPQSVLRSVELPGRVVAAATAQIRPQVDGIVRKRVFQEGASVKEGDVLFELDTAKFQAALASATASVQKAEATAANAKSSLDRSERLATTNTVSTQALEEARTTYQTALADVAVAKAAEQTAQINLDLATIKAPIAGFIGKSSVSVGALVTANQTDALATIRQIDPIFVDLVDSSANLLRIRDQVQAGTLGRQGSGPPKVTLTLENGGAYKTEGTLSLAEVAVSESTGTFSLRSTFANPDRVLMPGMFVRARVDVGVTQNAYLVPQRAVTRNATGEATAFFVDKDSKAVLRTLTTSSAVGNNWLVTAGISDGDRVVVDGLQRVNAGSTLKPVEVSVGDDGVVRQQLGTQQGGATK